MFLQSGSNYHILQMNNVIVYTESGLAIQNPNFKLRLLTYSEFSKVATLIDAKADSLEVAEEVFTACYLGILGFENEILNLDATPLALQLISDTIYTNSQIAIYTPDKLFSKFLDTTNLFDLWCGIAANILNIPFEDIVQKPVDEVIRLYTLAYLVTNRNIAPIQLEEK